MIQRTKYLCQDCKVDTRDDPKDFFMVKDQLWDAHGVGLGRLCVGCFENRLGRKLQKEDITDCAANYVNPYTAALLTPPDPPV